MDKCRKIEVMDTSLDLVLIVLTLLCLSTSSQEMSTEQTIVNALLGSFVCILFTLKIQIFISDYHNMLLAHCFSIGEV